MNTKVSPWLFLVPVIYAGFISYLLYMQFSGKVITKENIHHLAVVAETGTGTASGAVSSLEVRADGLTLLFSRGITITVETASNRIERPVSGYSIDSDSLNISFGDELALEIAVESGNSRRARIRAAAVPEGTITIAIPFSVADEYESSYPDNVPVLALNTEDGTEKKTHLVLLPESSRIERNPERFVLTSFENSFGEITLISDVAPTENPVAYWMDNRFQFRNANQYDEIEAEFFDKSYRGWLTDRYDGGSGEWRMPAGARAFDEAIMNMLLAESLSKGGYRSVLSAMVIAGSRHISALTYRSASFLGDIVNQGSKIEENDSVAIEEISNLLQREDTGIFTKPDLPLFAVDRAPYSVAEGLSDFASTLNIEETDVETAVGMLQAYVDSISLGENAFPSFSIFRSLVESVLLPSLFISGDGLFLITGAETCDIATALQAGKLLQTIGKREDETLESIGRELAASVLARSDASGYLPKSLNVEDGKLVNGSDLLGPEQVYRFLSHRKYVPREISFLAHEGPGTWMWTCADRVEVNKTDKRMTISLSFPVGLTHHLLIKGINPVSSLMLYGQQWRSDPRFQEYGSGWFYDADRRILYLKLTHRTEEEEVVIDFP